MIAHEKGFTFHAHIHIVVKTFQACSKLGFQNQESFPKPSPRGSNNQYYLHILITVIIRLVEFCTSFFNENKVT